MVNEIKEKILETLQKAKEENTDINDINFINIISYIKKTGDNDVIFALSSFKENYTVLPIIKSTMLRKYWQVLQKPEKANEYCDLIVKIISENPKAIENSCVIYLGTNVLNFVKNNLEKRSEKDQKIIELINQSIEKRKSIEEKEKQSKQQGILKNSNGVCYCCEPRENERSSPRRLFVNPGGSLSYRPTSSKSQRYR